VKFHLKSTDPHSKARRGHIDTDHGSIQTPVFMPVGTAGTVKGLHFHELTESVKAEIILGNTYHLYLRPGIEVIEEAGGLQKFTSWNKPMLTDSGGYQVYSLSAKRKLTEEGAHFTSHVDGSKHFFTPENIMDIQRRIGADIIMAFDECTPYPCEYSYARNSMNLTHRWLDRCMNAFTKSSPVYDYEQSLFPIVQGSVYPDLREESAKVIASYDCDGYAIGGLSVGEPAEDLYSMTDLVTDILPTDKARYLMGVGTPENLLESISRGIDMFDCVLPTRNARHGLMYTNAGIINIKNKKWEKDYSPVDETSWAPTSRIHSKAYVRHLLRCNEMLAKQITSLNNLAFFAQLMDTARKKLEEGNFTDWKQERLLTLMQRL